MNCDPRPRRGAILNAFATRKRECEGDKIIRLNDA
jgi:hypothetical protein